jgi:predicted amidohydrolase
MTKEEDKYFVIAIQTAHGNARNKKDVHQHLDRNIELIDMAVKGYGSNFGFPLKMVAFPELTIQGFPFFTTDECLRSDVPISIPGEETDRLIEVAKKYDIYIVTGSFIEHDKEWPNCLFNTLCIISPRGIEARYRKINIWIPLEIFTSPHSLEGYDEELFPVADLPIGKIAAAICYDYIFPETCRELTFKGAEIIVRASAYMHPWIHEAPTNWWTSISQVRSLENVVYGVHVNQGSCLIDYPPYSFTGGSCIVDYEGRILAQVLESGEHIVAAHIDLESLREWRANTYSHLMPVHLRSEAYAYLSTEHFPHATLKKKEKIDTDYWRRLIDESRQKLYPEITKRYKRK